jgi:multidrug resistance efflux pump
VPAGRDRPIIVGDTIVVLAAATSDRAREAVERSLTEQTAAEHDLRLLAGPAGPEGFPPGRLALPRLRASVDEARLEQRQLALEQERAARGRDRLQQLAARGFAAPAELDAAELELRYAEEVRALALGRRRAAWTVALSETEQRIAELRRDLARLQNDHAAFAVTAPVSGTLDELASLTPGSTVRAGDPVATISPDGSLMADVLVQARDVSNVRVGMQARLLIEGYDVQVWGAAAGTVVSVATDYTMSGEQPVFRVRVRPLGNSLRRPDGHAVPLKKGLRAQARLLTGRRRLIELLLHRAGEWIDPSAPVRSPEPIAPVRAIAPSEP